ncbi:MAG: hypothetical protein A2X23_05715 [Chloroflexi bacterium GWC2_73_18]|nr:MAG: hypothetical protein A2X23_05715 [Chloroflexi bacterium GWC2_73_18]
MRYADTLMSEGEHVVLRSRQHWLALLIEGRTGIGLFILGLIVFIVVQWLKLTAIEGVAGWATLALVVVGAFLFGWKLWNWWAQDYLVTNRRILKVEGVFNKRSADSSLEKINDAVLEQNVVGRLLGYGDLNILTAADQAIDEYRMLNHAPDFKRQMLNQKHQLELELEGGIQVTAPLRAAEPAAEPAAQAEEVTETLARLADLRDRGAITPEEYETKKQELLGRL